MLLYGTKDPLYDYKTNKWVASSPGFLAGAELRADGLRPQEPARPDQRCRAHRPGGNDRSNQLLPEGQARSTSTAPGCPARGTTNGSAPVAAVEQSVLGHGQDADRVRPGAALRDALRWMVVLDRLTIEEPVRCVQSAAGRRTPANLLANYDVAVANIAPRKDEAQVPAYSNVPLNPFFTKPRRLLTVPAGLPGVSPGLQPDRPGHGA